MNGCGLGSADLYGRLDGLLRQESAICRILLYVGLFRLDDRVLHIAVARFLCNVGAYDFRRFDGLEACAVSASGIDVIYPLRSGLIDGAYLLDRDLATDEDDALYRRVLCFVGANDDRFFYVNDACAFGICGFMDRGGLFGALCRFLRGGRVCTGLLPF